MFFIVLQFAFLLFLFLFFHAQNDVLAYVLSYALGHYVAPSPWLIALGLTAVLVLLGWGTEKLMKRCCVHTAKLWSCVLLAWLSVAGISWLFVAWRYQLGLVLGALVLGALLHWLNGKEGFGKVKVATFYHTLTWAALQLLALCLFVGIGNGVTDLQHYELRTAQALQSEHPKHAYKVGDKSFVTSHRLFAMRCYLLATTHKKGLADKIFEQMVPKGGAENLLIPTDEKQNLLFPSSNLTQLLGCSRHAGEDVLTYLHRCAWLSAFRNGQKRSAAIDYYLCALLLNRQLERFSVEIMRFYPKEVENGTLPTYYAQALMLYRRTCSQPTVLYEDNSVEANYQDYSDMADTLSDAAVRNNLLRRSYGETYWWWYSYGEH